MTHLAIAVSDLCKYLSEFVLSCKSKFIGLCMYLFCVCFSYIFLISFQRKFCKYLSEFVLILQIGVHWFVHIFSVFVSYIFLLISRKRLEFVFRFYHHQQSFCQSGSVWRPKPRWHKNEINKKNLTFGIICSV